MPDRRDKIDQRPLWVVNATRGQTLVAAGKVADRFWSRLRGLIGGPLLKTGEGLLITPCNSVHTHFMGFPGAGDPRIKHSDEWETDPRYVRVAKREEVDQESKEAGMARVMQLVMETRAKIAERAAAEAE